MDAAEGLALAKKASVRFAAAGLPPVEASSIESVATRSVARLWAGMGSVVELRLKPCNVVIIAKKVTLPKRCDSIGDARKKASYEVEASFYEAHAERLVAAGCAVPRPLLVERRGDGVTIVMTKLVGSSGSMDGAQTRRVLSWLAKLHGLYYGAAKADAAVREGLAAQGEYWYLDTRPDEHAAMPKRGWEGRLRLAARAIDERLKADKHQTIVHGDAKSANMLFAKDGEPLLYDFQYVGKACCAKDLAYCLCCASDAPDDDADLVAHYHGELCKAVVPGPPPSRRAIDDALALSYADLGRWMSGWGWWGHDLEAKIVAVLDKLDGGTALENEGAYAAAMATAFPVRQ